MLDSLNRDLNNYQRYLNALANTKSILNEALPKIDSASEKIGTSFLVDGLSADNKDIAKINTDIKNLIEYINSTIRNVDSRMSDTKRKIKTEEEKEEQQVAESA